MPLPRKVDKQTQTDDRPPDEDGFHYVRGHDGTRLRFRLLLGGPGGDHRIDPNKRTVICLHGLGERLESWEELAFRQQELPASFALCSRFAASQAPSDVKPKRQNVKRRARIAQGLAKRLNVALVDLRGFGGSGRAASSEPMQDTSFIALYTFTLTGDMKAFTEAARADIQASRHAGSESHTISVSGSTAVVRIVHRDAARFFASRRWLRLEKASKAPVRLIRLDLCNGGEVLDGAEPVDRPEVRRLTMYPLSYKVDKINRRSEDVMVIHALELREEALEEEEGSGGLHSALERCFEDMRQEPACISFSISRSRTGLTLQASLATTKAAVAHLRRVEAWLALTEEAVIGARARLDWAQLHARGPAVKELKASQEVAQLDVQLFQLFPLSFQSASATQATASMSDFIEDVESVRQYLAAPRVAIVGHSFGAAVALRYAVKNADRVERLLSLGGWGRINSDMRKSLAAIAGNTAGWTESVIRGAILDDGLEDCDLHRADVPMLLINAKDDFIVQADVSQELREALPNARLEMPSWGGHEAAAVNDEVLDRMAQFLLADEAMVFADDPLCAELLASPWNIGSDKAFERYYNLGRALAEVERAQRQLRLVSNWVRDCEFQDELLLQKSSSFWTRQRTDELHIRIEERRRERISKLQEEENAKFTALCKVGLEEYWQPDVAPRDVLIHVMSEMLEEMCAPAKLAVEQAGPWWRDTGKAAEGYTEGKYTVDAWGRRRGGSKKTNCAWFRWDLTCVPPRLREGYAMEAPDAEFFSCWWCGGLPTEHKNLGPMGADEEPGFYPGIAAGRNEWLPPPCYGLPTAPAPVLDECAEAGPPEPWADEWGPPFRRIRVQ